MYWMILVIFIQGMYLTAAYHSIDKFCSDHNCLVADKGWCATHVCAVDETAPDKFTYYKMQCFLKDGKPDHSLCKTMVKQDIIFEACIVIPLSIYYAVIVYSLMQKVRRGEIRPDAREEIGGNPSRDTATIEPEVSIKVSDDERAGLLGSD